MFQGFFPSAGATTISFAACYREVADLRLVIQEHTMKKWVFTPEQRAQLHKSLFLPFRSFFLSSHDEIFDGSIELIRNLQAAGLFVLAKRQDFELEGLSLQDVVTDVHQLTEHLSKSVDESDIGDFTDRDWEDNFWNSHLSIATDVSGSPGILRSETLTLKSLQRLRKKHYRNLLCDVMFGAIRGEEIPIVPATDGLLVEQFDAFFQSLSKCRLKNFLHSIEFSPRPSKMEMPELDALRLDAIEIESRGPFRFKATNKLEEHLVITPDKKILFYSEMQNFTPLYYNKVLNEDTVFKPADKLRVFDLIVCHYRTQAPVTHIRTGMAYLYDELYRHYYLFFGQQAINHTSEHQVLKTFLRRFRHTASGSIKHLTADEVRSGFCERLNPMGHYIPQHMVDKVSQYRENDVFKYRLDSVHETLRNWTPQTVFELRYSGYGSVDPVNRYVLLFTMIFGTIAIAGLSITAAQTYAAFKQLNMQG